MTPLNFAKLAHLSTFSPNAFVLINSFAVASQMTPTIAEGVLLLQLHVRIELHLGHHRYTKMKLLLVRIDVSLQWSDHLHI